MTKSELLKTLQTMSAVAGAAKEEATDRGQHHRATHYAAREQALHDVIDLVDKLDEAKPDDSGPVSV